MLLAAWRPPHVDPSSWGIVISLCALACALAPRREISTRSRWALAGAAALGCASLAASCQGLQSARTLVLFSAYGFAAWACAAHASGCPAGSPRRRGLDLAIAAAGTALATHGLYQAFYGFGRMAAALGPDAPEALRSRIASGRAVGTLGLPGSLAGLLILSIPVTAGLLLASRASRSPWRAVAAAGALAAQAAGLAATRSAAAVASLSLAAAIAAWPRSGGDAGGTPGRRRGRGVAAAFIVLSGGLAAAAIALWWGADPAAGGGPFALRLGNWRAALAMVADRPILGGGPGCFGILFPAYREWGMNESRFVHNSYLQLAAEAGVPAAVATVAAAAWLAATALGRGRGGAAGRCCAAALIAFLIHNALDFTLFIPTVALPFFCLAGRTAGAGGRLSPSPRGGMRLVRVAGCLGAAAFALVAVRADTARSEARDLALAGDPGALAAARRAVRRLPSDPEAHALVSRLLLERAVAGAGLETLEESERHARAAVDLDERTPSHWHHLGRVRLARSDRQGAYIALHRAAELYPIRIEYREDRDQAARLLSSDEGQPAP